MEDEALRTEVALFRFGVIGELVASRLEPGELTELIYQKSNQQWHIPGSHRTRVSAATVRRWLRLYERGGRELSALMPARRCDRGCSRTVDDETRGALIRLRKEQPGWPVWRLVQALAEKQLITPGTTLSLSTAYRILTQEKLDSAALHKGAPVDRRRYEAEFPNDIWQSDITAPW
jgi:putative transposase